MKRPLACVLAATLTAGLACSSTEQHAVARKLVILGIDGLDPDLVAAGIAAGRLPHLARLADAGGMHRLDTIHNPNTAAAWASFATGVNPGKHQVFDLLTRDPATYALRFATTARTAGRFLFDYLPLQSPGAQSLRGGTSFWVHAGRAGIRSTILSLPLTMPAEDVPNGQVLAGDRFPDTASATYHLFATDLPPDAGGYSPRGGRLTPLVFQRSRAQAEIVGPWHPLAASHTGGTLTAPFELTWNHEERSLTIDLAGQTVHLLEGRWSRWVELAFEVNALARVRGLVQFHLADAGQHLRLYASPVYRHPAAGGDALSSPASFARELHERLGVYRTSSFPAAAWALAENAIDESAFLEDLDREFNDRAETILSRIEAGDWQLLVGAIDAADHLQHVMWRSQPAIERMYRRVDEFVGELVGHLDDDTTLMIVSLHGFGAFQSTVHLNSWLVERGYMTIRGPDPHRRSTHDVATRAPVWDHVDWSKTRAFAVGSGQIFVNLRGRERQGIVSEGVEYDQVLDALLIDLLNFLDPRTQARVVAHAYKRAEIYQGPHANAAGDLIVALEEGYGLSWPSMLGATPAHSIEPNESHWTGEHSTGDHTALAGVLLSTRRPNREELHVFDIAPSVLSYFGVNVPGDLDGRAFY